MKIRYTKEENNNVMSRYDHKIETSLEGIDGKGDTEKRNHGESSRFLEVEINYYNISHGLLLRIKDVIKTVSNRYLVRINLYSLLYFEDKRKEWKDNRLKVLHFLTSSRASIIKRYKRKRNTLALSGPSFINDSFSLLKVDPRKDNK